MELTKQKEDSGRRTLDTPFVDFEPWENNRGMHRTGADQEGNPIATDYGEVLLLSAKVEEFCMKVADAFDEDFGF
ncbi:hypothetical protein AWB74_08271 [Caballeronia arvi]|uniref:Uncharacterized protein n=2 Tax=Caballeronia arvi TaxID=1777135 RepID=A0A158L397_9BURK|nr:hypothetical protein AWB74_08271 [Caballeronia arvi]